SRSAYWHIPAFASAPGESQPHNFRLHGIEAGRFEIEGETPLLLKLAEEALEFFRGIDEVVRGFRGDDGDRGRTLAVGHVRFMTDMGEKLALDNQRLTPTHCNGWALTSKCASVRCGISTHQIREAAEVPLREQLQQARCIPVTHLP